MWGRRPRRTVTVLGGCLALAWAATANAQLSPEFASRLTLDTAFVSAAPDATDIAFSGDGRAVVTRKTGQVVVRRADGSTKTLPYRFPDTLDSSSEKGLLGVVADPNVAQNRAFYFFVSNGPTNDRHRVYKAFLTADDDLNVESTPIVGVTRGLGPGLEGPANHDGGGLSVHGDKLYISVGDTGANASPPRNKYGSCLNKGNGKILRVNLDGSVPTDNPLFGVATVSACDSPLGAWNTQAPDRRIFAWGLRNPWRFWVDPQTALLWIGDVGEAQQEEISVGAGNQHYGYPFVEGTNVWGDVEGKNCSTLSPSRSCTPPVYSYPRSEGVSVTGGLIPAGCGWSSVFSGSHYVFADAFSGFIRALPVNATRTGLSSTTPLTVGTFSGAIPVSLRMGPDGALYVVMFAGSVYRLTPKTLSGPGCPAPVPANSAVIAGALGLSLLGLGVMFGTGRSATRNS